MKDDGHRIIVMELADGPHGVSAVSNNFAARNHILEPDMELLSEQPIRQICLKASDLNIGRTSTPKKMKKRVDLSNLENEVPSIKRNLLPEFNDIAAASGFGATASTSFYEKTPLAISNADGCTSWSMNPPQVSKITMPSSSSATVTSMDAVPSTSAVMYNDVNMGVEKI